MHFRYKAVTMQGKTVRGTLEADSERQAILHLQEQKYTPLSLEPTRPETTGGGLSLRAFLERLRPVPKGHVAAVVRQLTTLLAAGLPLDEALSALSTPDQGAKMQGVIAHIRNRIMEGGTFAEGLADFPQLFSTTFVTMVRAGEASGTLEVVMDRFAEHLEQQMTLTRKVQSALAYPLLMLVVGGGVVAFLLGFVIPKVTQIFSEMGRELPLPTRILLAVSDGFRSVGWLLGLVLVIAFIAGWRMLKTEKGRRFRDRMLLRLPGVRGVYRPLIVGQMTRTLGMLLKNGVTLVKALDIVRSVSDNALLGNAVGGMYDGVQAGRDLSEFMSDPLVFVPLDRQMVVAGERSGQLGEMLLWVARDCESRVSTRLQLAATLLEPFMILFLGVIVGFVVIAIMLPLFEMSSLVG